MPTVGSDPRALAKDYTRVAPRVPRVSAAPNPLLLPAASPSPNGHLGILPINMPPIGIHADPAAVTDALGASLVAFGQNLLATLDPWHASPQSEMVVAGQQAHPSLGSSFRLHRPRVAPENGGASAFQRQAREKLPRPAMTSGAILEPDMPSMFARALLPVIEPSPVIAGTFLLWGKGSAWQQWFRLYEAFPRPGTLWGDLLLLLLPGVIRPLREAALHGVAEKIPWRCRRHPQVWQAIIERAKQEHLQVPEIVHREKLAAILLALQMKDQPQYHRFGASWLKDAVGTKLSVTPVELENEHFWQWLQNTAIRIAEAGLVDRPFPGTKDVLDRLAQVNNGEWVPVVIQPLEDEATYPASISAEDVPGRDNDDPLFALLEREQLDANRTLVSTLWNRASPRQRELMVLLGAGLSRADAARRLGIEPETARAQLHRLRQKVV